jgi:hypothetical protein
LKQENLRKIRNDENEIYWTPKSNIAVDRLFSPVIPSIFSSLFRTFRVSLRCINVLAWREGFIYAISMNVQRACRDITGSCSIEQAQVPASNLLERE